MRTSPENMEDSVTFMTLPTEIRHRIFQAAAPPTVLTEAEFMMIDCVVGDANRYHQGESFSAPSK